MPTTDSPPTAPHRTPPDAAVVVELLAGIVRDLDQLPSPAELVAHAWRHRHGELTLTVAGEQAAAVLADQMRLQPDGWGRGYAAPLSWRGTWEGLDVQLLSHQPIPPRRRSDGPKGVDR